MTLHHARFARLDRERLDQAIETLFDPGRGNAWIKIWNADGEVLYDRLLFPTSGPVASDPVSIFDSAGDLVGV